MLASNKIAPTNYYITFFFACRFLENSEAPKGHWIIMELCIPCLQSSLCALLISSLLMSSTIVGCNSSQSKSDIPHSRQKRLLWVTEDGRLALPPGTTLVITPSLSLPFVRYPPDGFFSNMSIALPFTSKFYAEGPSV